MRGLVIALWALWAADPVLAFSADDKAGAHRAASCALSTDSEGSKQLALAESGSSEEASALARPKLARCIARHIPSAGSGLLDIMAGDIARQIHRSANISFRSTTIAAPETMAELRARPHVTKAIEGTADVPALAACVVGQDPEAADRFTRTVPGSAAEQRQFATISTLLTPCVEAGKAISFDRDVLRGAISRAFFRHVYEGAPFLP